MKEENILYSEHLPHFVYGYTAAKRLIYCERGNPPLPLRALLFLVSSKGYFICTIPTYWIVHITAFDTQVGEHWLKIEIA